MKIKSVIFILIFFSFYSINSICIEGQNCPFKQGYCLADKCECYYNYWSLIDKAQQISPIYCNYKKYNRFYILFIEFFLPSFGHLIAGKYYYFIIKFLLLFCPIVYFVIGFCVYKKDDEEKNEEQRNWEPSRENIASYNNKEINFDEDLHLANRENIKYNKWSQLSIILSFLSLIAFIIWHLIDIICYIFGLYPDGNGVPMV